VFIIARNDSWGIGLGNAVLKGPRSVRHLAKNIEIEVQAQRDGLHHRRRSASEFAPDAVLIGFAESSLIIKAFAAAGVAPSRA
jgi:hypothetical protein